MIKTASEKMGIKVGSRAKLIHAPAEAVKAMKLPRLVKPQRLSGRFDYLHFFVTTQREMENQFPKLKKYLSAKGMLWLSWPKSGKLDSDLNLKTVIKIGYDHGLVESKTLSINDTWSAIKFTHPKEGKVYQNSYGTLASR